MCGIARTVDEAVALAVLHEPDLALIDMTLADGGEGTQIAARLNRPGMGVLYASGTRGHVALSGARGQAILAKPYRPSDLVRSLKIVADIVATGQPSAPFPRGFQLLSETAAARTEWPHR